MWLLAFHYLLLGESESGRDFTYPNVASGLAVCKNTRGRKLPVRFDSDARVGTSLKIATTL